MTIDSQRLGFAVAYFACWLIAIAAVVALFYSPRWVAGLLFVASLCCLAWLAWKLAGERRRKPPP